MENETLIYISNYTNKKMRYGLIYYRVTDRTVDRVRTTKFLGQSKRILDYGMAGRAGSLALLKKVMNG